MSNFSQNLKKYRKRKGISQADIAHELYITAQTVSKWETGLSEPSLENLCRLSKILGVSADRLIGIRAETPPCLIGIDGGGTKTEFVLFTDSGHIISRVLCEGCNPNIYGIDSTIATLKKGIDSLLSGRDPNVMGICAGLAGCGNLKNKIRLEKSLKEIYEYNITVTSDIKNVIGSVEKNDECIAAICGTGSSVFASFRGEIKRFGGWGYIFESGGSGYSIGRDAVRAALAENDGVGEKTLLKDMIEKKIGGNIWDSIDILYKAENSYIASLSREVFSACESGDKVAHDIIEKNISELAFFINAAADRYKEIRDVIIAGGITAHRNLFYKSMRKKVYGRLNIIFPKMPQVYGACFNSCTLYGKPQNGFMRNFANDYLSYMDDMPLPYANEVTENA